MIQGVGKAIRDLDIDDNALRVLKPSSNPCAEERSYRDVINGAGEADCCRKRNNCQEVNRLLKNLRNPAHDEDGFIGGSERTYPVDSRAEGDYLNCKTS
jgi:hypothetical protein